MFCLDKSRPDGQVFEIGVQMSEGMPDKWGVFQKGELKIGMPEQSFFSSDFFDFIGEKKIELENYSFKCVKHGSFNYFGEHNAANKPHGRCIRIDSGDGFVGMYYYKDGVATVGNEIWIYSDGTIQVSEHYEDGSNKDIWGNPVPSGSLRERGT